MSTRNNKSAALAKKLSRLQELRSEGLEEKSPELSEQTLPDIEDIVNQTIAVKSEYFSPLQTRRQRLVNKNPIQRPELSAAVKKSALNTKLYSEVEVSDIPIKQENQSDDDKIIQVPKIELNSQPLKVELMAENDAVQQQFKSPTKVSKRELEASVVPANWEPLHWRQIFENVRTMRANAPAPVDTMGCEACADTSSDDKTQRYHKLLALMLSSQTKDEITFGAMGRLKANTKNLTPEAIVAMETSVLEQLLYPVGFYKNKAKYLQQTARILIEKYSSDIPKTIKDLISLPGVGPKMAHICMSTAWNEITGIGVDVHVHRISNRLGWVPRETKEPEQTRAVLEAWLPRDLWHDVNYLFVGFGQTICMPVRPKCSECLNNKICPMAFKVTPKKKSATRDGSSEKKRASAKKSKITPSKQNSSMEEENSEASTVKEILKKRTKKNIQL